MLASVVEGFERRVSTMQEQGTAMDSALRLLLSRAGVDVQAGIEGAPEREEAVIVVPPAASNRSVEDKRKELALAGGLGFAVGAGILAAMGALRS